MGIASYSIIWYNLFMNTGIEFYRSMPAAPYLESLARGAVDSVNTVLGQRFMGALLLNKEVIVGTARLFNLPTRRVEKVNALLDDNRHNRPITARPRAITTTSVGIRDRTTSQMALKVGRVAGAVEARTIRKALSLGQVNAKLDHAYQSVILAEQIAPLPDETDQAALQMIEELAASAIRGADTIVLGPIQVRVLEEENNVIPLRRPA